MSILLPLLAKTWPFLLCLAIGAAGGGYVTFHWDTAKYAELQAKFSAYQAQVNANAAAAERAAAQALQGEITTAYADDARNAKIIEGLQSENLTLAGKSRDLAQRLLTYAARTSAPAGGSDVPKAAGEPGAAAAGPPESASGIGRRLAAAFTECDQNADQLDALIAELKPQL